MPVKNLFDKAFKAMKVGEQGTAKVETYFKCGTYFTSNFRMSFSNIKKNLQFKKKQHKNQHIYV